MSDETPNPPLDPGLPEGGDAEARAARFVEEFLALFETEESPDIETFLTKVPEQIRATVRERLIDIGFIKRVFKARETTEKVLERSDISTGRELGDFRMLREVGRGAMGVVYLARQMSLNRLVAVKVLLPHLALSERQVERFRREALSAAKLQHPGIVPIYAVGKAEGMHFFAMEFVPGRSLAAEVDGLRVRRREQGTAQAGDRLDVTPGRSYPAEVAEIGAQLAEALHYAHQRGIIHRDVKPQNVLIGEGLQPFLVDFGLAKDLEELSLSRSGEIAGTPYYMSPEQALAKRVKIDHRTDVYSLGVVLYEMLTLRRPFEGKTSNEVLFEITFKEPPPIRTLEKRVPRDLETIVSKAMEKSPERRYASAGEMAADLRRFLGHESIFARPPSFLEVGRRKLVRHRTIAVASAAALLALGVGTVVTRELSARTRLASDLEALASIPSTNGVATLGAPRLRELAVRAQQIRDEFHELDHDDEAKVAAAESRLREHGLALKAQGLALSAKALKNDSTLPAPFGDLKLLPSAMDLWQIGQALALLQEAAVFLPDDVELRDGSAMTRNFPRLSLITDREGDRVSLRALPLLGTELGPKQEIGVTPLHEAPVPPGFYRVIVERAGSGFAECTRYLDEPGRAYELRPQMLASADATARGMVRIPGGEFEFGDPQDPVSVRRARKESLPDYWIDRCEVSNAEYRAFVQTTGWKEPELWKGGYDTSFDNLPIAGIRWTDAVAYAEWVGKRLPTQYEWSRAARGTHGYVYPWGNVWGESPGAVETRASLGRPDFVETTPEGLLATMKTGLLPVDSLVEGRSPEGILHTLDNVMEWTETMCVSDVEHKLVVKPGFQVLCGGKWSDLPAQYKLYDERQTYKDNAHVETGFRCAKSIEP